MQIIGQGYKWVLKEEKTTHFPEQINTFIPWHVDFFPKSVESESTNKKSLSPLYSVLHCLHVKKNQNKTMHNMSKCYLLGSFECPQPAKTMEMPNIF